MISDRTELILSELQEGTGASFAATVRQTGLRPSLKIWFNDLDQRHGPVAELIPYGLKGHQVQLYFGNFAAAVINQMQQALKEDVQLARALIASVRPEINLEIFGQQLTDWKITDGSFRITATVRSIGEPNSDFALVNTCREIIVPLMAAMAELIGYDAVESGNDGKEERAEGEILYSTIRRRERNPRNRLLCIRIHGERCAVCGLDPRFKYGKAGGIIEVHHLQPLSTIKGPRVYDPGTDLIPLCPTCHRAAHTKRPLPFTPDELRDLMEISSA
jgi:5-methylcytosine-specific restriction protein A